MGAAVDGVEGVQKLDEVFLEVETHVDVLVCGQVLVVETL
jgi:hypothetical protein